MFLGNYDPKNAIKYTSPKWDNMLAFFQVKTVAETVNFIRTSVLNNGITVSFKNQDLYFDVLKKEDLEFKCEFKPLPNSSVRGYYDVEEDKIYINNSIRNDGMLVFETIYHEAIHAIQHALEKHIDKYSENSLEFQYLTLIKSESCHEKMEMTAFGISAYGDVYISNEILNNIYATGLNDAFYALQISERNAISTGDEAYNYILNLNSQQKGFKQQAIKDYRQKDESETIRKVYNAPGLMYSDICNLMDAAKLNIINGISPTSKNDLEAVITYDLISILKLQTATTQTKAKLIEDYKWSVRENVKKHILYSFYENEQKHFVINPQENRMLNFEFLKDLLPPDIFTPSDLEALDVEEQKRNLHLIPAALFFGGKDAIPFIKDMSAFKEWYYSNANNLTEEMQNLIAGLLGPEFSPEVQKIKNQEFNQNFLKEHPEYSKGIDHENEDCHVQKYRLNEKHDVPPWKPTQKNESKNKSAIEPEI